MVTNACLWKTAYIFCFLSVQPKFLLSPSLIFKLLKTSSAVNFGYDRFPSLENTSVKMFVYTDIHKLCLVDGVTARRLCVY